MDKILPLEISFEHILNKNECISSNKKLPKSNKKVQTNSIVNKGDTYLNELISKINIINEEFYDYIIFDCGNKNTSKEFKKGVRSHLDKVMVNYFKK